MLQKRIKRESELTFLNEMSLLHTKLVISDKFTLNVSLSVYLLLFANVFYSPKLL